MEKEAQTLKKKLAHEQKAKLQKTHARIQEARSSKQMELAKSTNIDKLVNVNAFAYINQLMYTGSSISCKLFFVEIQYGSSFIDQVLLHEET